MLLTLQENTPHHNYVQFYKLNWMQHLPYRVCFASILPPFGTLALLSSKGSIGPHQIDGMLALVLHHDLLAKAMT